MTEDELKSSLNMMLTNYNKPVDEHIMALWKGLFINFNASFFQNACLKVMVSNKFFPNASEIIDAYQYLRREARHDHYEKLKASQKLLTSTQAYCYLCDNKGICIYPGLGCEYMARCICSHGQDLNMFSMAQIKHDYKPELKEHYPEYDKDAIKQGKNPFYILTIKEAYQDDFIVFDAQKKDKFLSREAVTDAEKVEILKKIRTA